MSAGFALRLWLDGRPGAEHDAARALDRFAHRVADRRISLTSGPLELAVAERCATTGSDRVPQPHPSRCGRFLVVLDGRLDYVDDLRRALPACDVVADVEFLAEAYSRWGDAAFVRLEGEFVAIIWELASRTLTIARAALTGPPCFYHLGGRSFVAANEVQQLVRQDPSLLRVNEPMLAETLTGFAMHRTETLYEGVLRLEPAHVMKVDATGSVRTFRYWELEPQPTLTLDSIDDYVDAWWDVVSAAVRSRFRAIGPLGVDVSGGLDSSSLAAVTKRLRGTEGWKAIVQEFAPGSWADEKQWSDAVIDHLGVDALRVDGEACDVDEILRQAEILLAPPSAFSVGCDLALHRIALPTGIRVHMQGHGGDEVWGMTSERLLAALANRRWSSAADEFRCALATSSAVGVLRSAVITPLLLTYAPRRQAARRARYRARLLTEQLWVAGNLERRLSPDGSLPPASASRFELLKANAAWRISTSAELATASAADAMWGVERTTPYLDRRTVEFSAGLPESCVEAGSWNRRLLRLAMQGHLPEAVVRRREKAEFSQTFRHAIISCRGVRQGPGGCEFSAWIDTRRLDAAESRCHAGGDTDAVATWSAMSVGFWANSIGKEQKRCMSSTTRRSQS